MFFRLCRSAACGISLGLLIACGHSSGSSPGDGGEKNHDAGGKSHDAGEDRGDAGVAPTDARGPVDSGRGLATPVDILTQRGDSQRTGVNAHETLLTQSNVTSQTFGLVGKIPVDGTIYSQPLFVASYPLGGRKRNLLVVATSNNSIYAFDADTLDPVWPDVSVSLGPAVPTTAVGNSGAIPNLLGVMGTPVIDRDNGLIYVANADYFANDASVGVVAHRFHVLSLATGKEMTGSPILVSPSIPGTVDHATTLLWKPINQLHRAGLLLLDGVVYVAYASQRDRPPYHGFIVGFQYDVAQGTLTQKVAWASTQDGAQGGIWQGGQGLTADDAGSIYVTTSNGTCNVQDGGASYGQAFVKLSPSASSLAVKDWFAPFNWADLTAVDLDTGSGGPILVPGTHLVVGAGKTGLLYVLDTENLGHMVTGDTQVVQEIQAVNAFFGSPLAWVGGGATRLYIWGPDKPGSPPAPLKQFVLSSGKFGTTPAVTSTATTVNANQGGPDPVGILSLSSNGDTAGTAILWASKPVSDPNNGIVPGMLYAFNPLTLEELWDSDQNQSRDGVGNYAKFVPPTVSNGRVFMATASNDVAVYGLLPEGG